MVHGGCRVLFIFYKPFTVFFPPVFGSLLVKIGERHPDPVVETSSLSSVNPPNVWYRLSIPEETIDRGWLSALQLEAITYACQVRIYELLGEIWNSGGFHLKNSIFAINFIDLHESKKESDINRIGNYLISMWLTLFRIWYG